MRSAFAIYTQEIEDCVMEKIREYIWSQGIDIYSLIHDGLITSACSDQLLRGIEDYIAQHGWDIRLAEKPLHGGLRWLALLRLQRRQRLAHLLVARGQVGLLLPQLGEQRLGAELGMSQVQPADRLEEAVVGHACSGFAPGMGRSLRTDRRDFTWQWRYMADQR